MNITTSSSDLQVAAKQYARSSSLSTLNGAGLGSIVFGALAVYTGFSNADVSSMNTVLGVLGCGLVIEGLWLLASKVPVGFIIDGIALMTIGVWNFLVTIANGAATGQSSSMWAMLGVFQIAWGVQSICKYGKIAGSTTAGSPDTAKRALGWVGKVVKEIKEADPKSDPRIVGLCKADHNPFTFEPAKAWRCQLRPDGVVMVNMSDDADIGIYPPDEFSLEIRYPRKPGMKLPQLLKVDLVAGRDGSTVLRGKMPSEQAERYETWKRHCSAARPAAPAERAVPAVPATRIIGGTA